MEQQLLLPLLRPKLALVANLGSVSHVIARRRSLLRLSCYKSVRNLGLDYSAGAARFSQVRNTRISKAIGRARRLAFLKAGPSRSANIARSSLMPMGLYGAGVTGMLVAQVARLRTAVHIGVFAKPSGRSCTVDLALLGRAGIDPAVSAVSRPRPTLQLDRAPHVNPDVQLHRRQTFPTSSHLWAHRCCSCKPPRLGMDTPHRLCVA
jgi:hypothetical protein